jgi:hypothetical protein
VEGVEDGDQVGRVAGAEEPLGALPQVGVVPVPAEAVAGADGLGDPGLVLDGRGGELEGAGNERRAGLVGQGEGLLLGQVVAVGRRSRGHLATLVSRLRAVLGRPRSPAAARAGGS